MIWEGLGRGCVEAKLGWKNGLRPELGRLGRSLGDLGGEAGKWMRKMKNMEISGGPSWSILKLKIDKIEAPSRSPR